MFGCKPDVGLICDTCEMVEDKESIFAKESMIWINTKELITKTKILVNYEKEHGIPIWTSYLAEHVIWTSYLAEYVISKS